MRNNLYSNLVNFYNVNDENFKEFMAEIYKEMLTTHRDVQYVKEHLTEEIEKKLEIYLVDGKFNINIEEKVNEFLENNQEIKDIISKLNTNTNKIEDNTEKLNTNTSNIENITSQLDTKANQSDVFKRTNYRYFKPNFGYNVMWGETTDTNGGYVSKNNIERGNDIKLCERLHIDEITLALFMGYNSNTDTLYSTVNIADVKRDMEYYKDYNVKIKTVKIHFGSISESYLFNTITFEKFDRLYKEFLKYICQQFQNTTVENITVINEFFSIDNNPAYTSNVVNWLNIVKSYGYKTGITCAGVEKAYLVQPEIHQNSDLICVNCYPKISFIGNKITNEMCVNTWLQHDLKLFFEQMKKKYPDKKLIISETGVTNKWNDLIGSLPSYDTSSTDNKATETYLNGIFGSLNEYPIDGVWWWFGIWTGDTKIQELFDYNLRGVINNE